jgi:hypothetical protein
MSLVLDSSVVGCWCFADEANPIADAAFDQVGSGGATAPVLWWFEVRNVLVVNERRGRIDPPGSAAFSWIWRGCASILTDRLTVRSCWLWRGPTD